MKKILAFLIIAAFFTACNPETDDEKNDNPSDTTEIVNNNTDKNTENNNGTLSEEEIKDILEKTEEINNELDSILNTL